MENQNIQPTGCCPPFDPAIWDNKEVVWDNKIFVKDRVHSLFHIPMDMGRKVVKNMALIKKAGAEPAQGLMLFDENSLWGSDIYIDVTHDVPEANMAQISGKFVTRVFEGPYKNAGLWAKEMMTYVAAKGQTSKKLYFSYTTCPNCAKAYGKNYVVLFSQIG